jgi:phage terminase small subunit
MKRRGDLNEKEKHFVTAFIKEPNGAKAARAAGYSPKAAKEQASRLLTRANVKAEIEKRRAKIAERAEIDAAYVLRQAVEAHERCMQEIRPFMNRKGVHQTDEAGNLLYVFNASGALKALELVGKHVNVGAFKDNGEHTGQGGKPLSLTLQQFIFNSVENDRAKQIEGDEIW